MGQHHEREQIREAAAAAQRAQQEQRVQQMVTETQKSYAAVKELIENPLAWKALLSLRAKLRRIRSGWLAKQLDSRVPHTEKDVLLGQYNAALLIFDVIDQIKEIHKNMVPGKEADYIREKLFKNPSAQQQR